MFVTNGKKITVQDAQDEDSLKKFAEELFDGWNKYKGLKGKKALKPDKFMLTAAASGIERAAIEVPEKMDLNFILDFGCELKALFHNDVISKRGRASHEVKHVFTEEEAATNAMKLASACQELQALDNEMKQVQAGYGHRIKAAKAQQGLLANHVANGYDIRNIEVEVVLDFSSQMRRYIDPANKKPVGEEPLTPEDYQFQMFDA